MIYLKVISLIACLFFTSSVLMKAICGDDIDWEMFLAMAIGWTTFIFSMGWLSP